MPGVTGGRGGRGVFGGAELEFRGHTGEWMGHATEHCTAQARREESGGVRLELSLRPAAAHRAAGAAEESSAAPIGYGWNGSFDYVPRVPDDDHLPYELPFPSGPA